jgi:hypothetical protein
MNPFYPMNRIARKARIAFTIILISSIGLPAYGEVARLEICTPTRQPGGDRTSELGTPTATEIWRPPAIAEYRGNWDRITPDGQGLLTYVEATGTTHRYTFEGDETAQFTGWLPQFSPDQQIGVFNDVTSPVQHVYRLTGDHLATIRDFYGFTPNGQQIITTNEANQTTQILNLQGETVATLDGVLISGLPNVITTPEGEGFILTIQGSPYDQTQQRTLVYDVTGQARFRHEGLLTVAPDQRGVLTPQAPLQRLNWAGEVQETLTGDRIEAWLPDDQGVLTVSVETEQTHLLTWAGEHRITLAGLFQQFVWPHEFLLTELRATATPTETSPWILTHSPSRDQYGLYTLEGHEIGSLPTTDESLEFGGISPDGQYWALRSHRSPLSTHLQSPDGTLILPGSFGRFLPDGRGLITRTEEGIHLLYALDGTLQSSLTWEPIAALPDLPGLLVRDHTLFNNRIVRLDGTVHAELPGSLHGLLPGGQGLILYSASTGDYALYNFDGEKISTLPFSLPPDTSNMSPDETRAALYSYELDETHLIDLTGKTLAIFPGYFRAFIAEGSALVTYQQQTQSTTLFCVPPSE